ncbi:restriction endonuclease [Tannerella sp. oral taxon 808]|nr:restriction endonuclease [Tannerella sp. oral taxon 808]
MSKQKKREERKTAKDFGEKEGVLNLANRRFGLTRSDKVGTVMALIRECQPQTIEEWETWYFEHAKTEPKKNARKKQQSKVTRESIKELGERLYDKITEVVIPEWKQAFKSITIDDCIGYIKDVTINRTYDGYLRENFVVCNGLSKEFPELRFVESTSELDRVGNVDYIAWVGKYAIGIQIKPITAQGNSGDYSLTERMQASFQDFKERYKGEVFIVFTSKNEIYKKEEVIEAIRQEIDRLSTP